MEIKPKLVTLTNMDIGLTSKEVQEQIDKGFINTQSDKITKSYQAIFKDNIFTLFNLINAILAGFIILIGSWRNLLFLGTILSNIVIGIIQELRSKIVLDKLALITQATSKVLRDQAIIAVPIAEIVKNDIILVASSNQIVADAIVRVGKVEVNESLVTGEADIITKREGDLLYSGSFIVSGNAKVQVVHVGNENYAQTIMADAKIMRKHKSQLRDSINFIIKTIGIIIIPMGILLFLKQCFISDYTFAESIVATVAALIGMIPEGLVLLTSVALAVGTINLAKRKTLVQELYCIETLARVDVLCLDKTGTITEGNMQVEAILPLTSQALDIKDILANFNDALQDDNATSLAISKYVGHSKLPKVALKKLTFSSARKCSAVSFKDEGTYIIGAYEFICDNKDEQVQAKIQEQANLGNRVLVVVHSTQLIEDETIDKQGVVIALIILSDPIRKEAPATLDYFLAQGVDVKVISGDDPRTVHEIAHKANLKNYDKFIDMSTVGDEDIAMVAKTYTIFGRVSPLQKKLIIKALKEQGHITAMIGDGVNDVMALKEADCSISVAQGSEAAKNIANLVLLDNNFANMPHIVDEGRRVINNIQRAASLFLVKTTFSTAISFLTLFFLAKYPFIPIQLTLISSLTIGIPSFFLALEANHARVNGNFLMNVFSKAFPGALCVTLSVIAVHLLSYFIVISDDQMTTMSVILTGTSSIIVLYRVCMPFSRNRKIIFFTMSIAFILSVVFLPNVFMLVRLNIEQCIALVIGMVCIPFVMDFFFRFGNRFHLKEKIIKMAYHK